jgi:hypothetical protein
MTTAQRLIETGLEFPDGVIGLTTKSRVKTRCPRCLKPWNPVVRDILKPDPRCRCGRGPKTKMTWEALEAAASRHQMTVARSGDRDLVGVSKSKVAVRCRCGVAFEATPQDLFSGHTKSCGCSRIKNTKKSSYTWADVISAAGQHGNSIVGDVSPDEVVSGVHSDVEMRCSCGATFYPKINAVLSHIWRSCGCKTSGEENEVADFIAGLGVEVSKRNRDIIEPLEVDIWIPSHRIAIEYEGLHWHGEGILGRLAARTNHVLKSQRLRALGIRLILIFSDEWVKNRGVVESRLRAILGKYTDSVGARSCFIDEVEPPQARALYQAWHLQGFAGGVHLCLRRRSIIVALATFAKSNASRAKTSGWELMRFCVKPGFRVHGALSRMLKDFSTRYQVDEVLSYSDNRWSQGGVYTATGFVRDGDTPIGYWWFDSRGNRYHRYTLRKSVLLKRFGGDPRKTEYQLATENGYDRIWDLGCIRWIWRKVDKCVLGNYQGGL